MNPKPRDERFNEFTDQVMRSEGLRFLVLAPESRLDPQDRSSNRAGIDLLLTNGHWVLDDVQIEGCTPQKSDSTEYTGRIIRIVEQVVENDRSLAVWGRLEHPAENGDCPESNGSHYAHRFFTAYLK